MYGSPPMNDIFSFFPLGFCRGLGHGQMYGSACILPNEGHRDVLVALPSVTET